MFPTKFNSFSQVKDFIQRDIWRIRSSKLPKKQSYILKQIRTILLAVRGFNEDQCILRASALTFYSLLSMVPILAMAFGIAKGFGFEALLEKEISKGLRGQEEVAVQVIGFARSFLENVQGGVIAGIGVAILFYTVIKVLSQIEESFNDIWGVKQARAFSRKFSDYISVMMICPIMFIMAGSVTVLITSQINLLLSKLSFLGPIADVIIFSMRILPFAVMWFVFSFIYTFMPNTKVNYKSGLLGGIIGGTAYQLWQWVYITFQIGVNKYGAVYGSFAALPLFLVWLQVSWFIVLFGAEISFAHQNVETYEFEPDCDKVSQRFKRQVGLIVAQRCVAQFRDGKAPLSSTDISQQLDLPVRLVRQTFYDLTQAGILREVKYGEQERTNYYQPALDIDKIYVSTVLEGLERSGCDDIPYNDAKEAVWVRHVLKDFSTLLNDSSKNILLKDVK